MCAVSPDFNFHLSHLLSGHKKTTVHFCIVVVYEVAGYSSSASNSSWVTPNSPGLIISRKSQNGASGFSVP